MTEPTPEAYEPTDEDVEAMATHPLIAVWQAGIGSTGRDFDNNEAMVIRYALNVMRRVHAKVVADAQQALRQSLFAASIDTTPYPDEGPALRSRVEELVRAKIAAEIRAESLGWCMNSIGRHLVENCARIAEGSTDG